MINKDIKPNLKMKDNHRKNSKNFLDFKSENPIIWFYRLKGI